jgi:hypothetical protein
MELNEAVEFRNALPLESYEKYINMISIISTRARRWTRKLAVRHKEDVNHLNKSTTTRGSGEKGKNGGHTNIENNNSCQSNKIYCQESNDVYSLRSEETDADRRKGRNNNKETECTPQDRPETSQARRDNGTKTIDNGIKAQILRRNTTTNDAFQE